MRGFIIQEFMLATNVSESEEAAEEKLRWAFRLYDKDSSGTQYSLDIQPVISALPPGTIDCKEMMDIVGNLYEMEGFSKVTTRHKTEGILSDSRRTPQTRRLPQSSECWIVTMVNILTLMETKLWKELLQTES